MLVLLCFLIFSCLGQFLTDYKKFHYVAIQVSPNANATDIAFNTGFVNKGLIGELSDFYLLEILKKKSKLEESMAALRRDPRVVWMERQKPKKRFKRFTKRDPSSFSSLTNPFKNQWHLNVWNQNITGKGVVVAIVDDGIDTLHLDLRDAIFHRGSMDFTNTPNTRSSDGHGTKCAGEVSAMRNEICGMGVAFESKVSDIRILTDVATDLEPTSIQLAQALTFLNNENHIYSCSWGPIDDGMSLMGPTSLVQKALEEGTAKGRNGKGSVFVFGSGNGGRFQDNGNFDGFANSIYTLTIGSISQSDTQIPDVSEPCSCLLAVTYSGPLGGPGIFTTDSSVDLCSDKHGGSSASVPLASGLVALALSIRPELTWRDVQFLVMTSAQRIQFDDPSWIQTFKKRWFSPQFGYGKMDATALIESVKKHSLLPPFQSFQSPLLFMNASIPFGSPFLHTTYTVTQSDMDRVGLKSVEQVVVTVDISHARRGDLSIFLVSPNQITSSLILGRIYDESTFGFRNWSMSSVMHWGEPPQGPWTLVVQDTRNEWHTGTLYSWQLHLYGSS